jgi:aminopeptidase N
MLCYLKNRIIPSNLKSVIACTAIRHGGKKEWDFAYERFHLANVASEKADLLDAMGCSTKTWILSS